MRRQLREKGKAVLDASMGDFPYKSPITVSADSLLYEAVNTFKQHKVDNLIVLDGNRVSGILDIQDFVREGLIGG